MLYCATSNESLGLSSKATGTGTSANGSASFRTAPAQYYRVSIE